MSKCVSTLNNCIDGEIIPIFFRYSYQCFIDSIQCNIQNNIIKCDYEYYTVRSISNDGYKISALVDIKYGNRIYTKYIEVNLTQNYRYILIPFIFIYSIFFCLLVIKYLFRKYHLVFLSIIFLIIFKISGIILYVLSYDLLWTILKQLSHIMFTSVLSSLISIWTNIITLKTLCIPLIYIIIISIVSFIEIYTSIAEAILHIILILTLVMFTLKYLAIRRDKRFILLLCLISYIISLSFISLYITSYIILISTIKAYIDIVYIGQLIGEIFIFIVIIVSL